MRHQKSAERMIGNLSQEMKRLRAAAHFNRSAGIGVESRMILLRRAIHAPEPVPLAG